MAFWIWSMAMSCVARDAAIGVELGPAAAESLTNRSTPLVRVSDYLQSSIAAGPLPDHLLDRLADLYWTERESQLAI
ncbi:hypothetical protein [Hyphomicrobium sp.]|uniref:hypothetical protein n=1 Tax=Hyphomicrobium sp. TaxID=82 RepID=UPI002D7E5063|nr:hypothetical protein [Hyphomicrobium sp.]